MPMMNLDTKAVNDLDFQTVYESFYPKIVRYLAHMIGGRDAEDLTQEVFVKINHSLESFRGESQLSTWVYKIATNAALDRLRSPSFVQKGQKSLSDESMPEGEIQIIDVDSWTGEKKPSVETSMIRKEMNACIRAVIEKLPENYRTVMVLSELEGFKNEEIAEIIGVSIDTVKIRLHRGRGRLKRELQKQCSFYRDDRNEFACQPKETVTEVKK